MSHFSRLKTKFRHREVLIQCLSDLGHTVEMDTTIMGHEGKHSVDIAVKTRSGYGIGFVQNSDGTYDMVADWWGVKGFGQKMIAAELKRQAEKIQKEYVRKMVLTETAKDGFELVSQTEEVDGTVRIVVRRWA
jgi:adenosylmethionine-8-amino-7-oxononanoate aminotransferase